MVIPLPELRLAFTDFVLLAIMLTIMYGITVFEAVSTSGGWEGAGVSLDLRKRAATWAFAGVVFTLMAGVAAGTEEESHRSSVYLGVPLVFVGHWAYFHWKSSKLIDVQVILKHFDDAYKKAVLETLERNPQGLSIEQIRQLALQSDVYFRILRLSRPLVKSAATIPIAKMLDELLPTEDKTEAILRSLIKAAVVQQVGTVYRVQR